jgi:hypothetical protein
MLVMALQCGMSARSPARHDCDEPHVRPLHTLLIYAAIHVHPCRPADCSERHPTGHARVRVPLLLGSPRRVSGGDLLNDIAHRLFGHIER